MEFFNGLLGVATDLTYAGPNAIYYVVPEPASLSLMIAGCAAFSLFRVRRRE